jgi:hypothetical protein
MKKRTLVRLDRFFGSFSQNQPGFGKSSTEPVPKLIDCALKRTVLDQALAVFQAKALQNCVF